MYFECKFSAQLTILEFIKIFFEIFLLWFLTVQVLNRCRKIVPPRELLPQRERSRFNYRRLNYRLPPG